MNQTAKRALDIILIALAAIIVFFVARAIFFNNQWSKPAQVSSRSVTDNFAAATAATSSGIVASTSGPERASLIAFNKSVEWQLPGQTMTLVVASTSAEQQLGLGQRASLASTTGMLFVFAEPGTYGFWMKDMSFSIDIIWLDQDFKIIHIEKNLSPATYPSVYMPDSPAKYVIEVNAGFTDTHSLDIGQTMDIQ